MTRTERRLLIDTAVLGIVLTLLLAMLDWSGALEVPERFFYDFRARHFQYFTPPPTDKLVHLDIDDATLAAVGRWPWPRNVLAEIIDEIRLAGAKVVALDVIFPEPEPPAYEEVPSTQPTSGEYVAAHKVDHDAMLASAIQRHGKVLVPLSLNLNAAPVTWPLYPTLIQVLYENLELECEQAIQHLRDKGHNDANLAEQVNAHFFDARREAMFRRIDDATRNAPLTLEQLRAKLLPGTGQEIAGSPLLRLLEAQYLRHQSLRSLSRFQRRIPPNLPRLLGTTEEQTMLAAFGDAAAWTGFVDYVPLSDGVVRSVPLWADYRDTMFPQIGLTLACAMLDIRLEDVKLGADSVILPHPDGDIVIPVTLTPTRRGNCGMFLAIPWFGTDQWHTLFDYPNHTISKQHLSLGYIWEACQLRHRLAKNNKSLDDALTFMLSRMDASPGQKRATDYTLNPPPLDDLATRLALAQEAMVWMKENLSFFATFDPKDMTSEERSQHERLLKMPDLLPPLVQQVTQQNKAFQADLATRRAELRHHLEGKAGLMGYTAVGAIADVVPTSLHARCPGVMVHGVVFNAIMTRDFWKPAPTWVTMLFTLSMGLLMAAMVSALSPWKALAGALVLGGGYFLLNGLYLFDKHNLIVGMTGPLTAVATVWAGGTLVHYVLERSLRSRMRRRFGRYVDPALIDYAMDHEAELHGQRKELTVVFTDLAGFTRLSEQLGERIVPVLNEYMGLMVPVIRQDRCGGRAYVIKFLGDGIMYFFGAPFENAVHAYDAVASVLDMLPVMDRFNQALESRGLPPLSMRAGIASGDMIVGDAGSPDGSDYTVLGDTVNLGARLEPANKIFGTTILLNQRAYELIHDRVLCRPIGKIQVVGKKEGVQVFEALALLDQATDQQRQLADLTAAVIEPFSHADFDQCLSALANLEAVFGPTKFTAQYRQWCEAYLREAPEPGFNGQIILTAK
jgi:class 3 adenylate cyclase